MKSNEGENPCATDWYAFTARRLVAREFDVAETALTMPNRAKADVAFARQVAMYLAHVVYQLSYGEVALAFHRDRSTVTHACAIVEDARDDPAFEMRIAKLEDRLERLANIRRCGQISRHGVLAHALAGDRRPQVVS